MGDHCDLNCFLIVLVGGFVLVFFFVKLVYDIALYKILKLKEAADRIPEDSFSDEPPSYSEVV